MFFPSGFDFGFMEVDLGEGGSQVSRLQAEIVGQCDLGVSQNLASPLCV